jgi:membrane protein implicated in regulation of membrane protease activity
MLESIFAELGPWNWMVLGFVLLALEILVPGVFLLWIGIAALLIGALSLAIWDAGFWVWEVQILAFLVLALISAFLGNRIMSGRGNDSDQPLLNRRAEQFVGRVATLAEPINDGRGRLRLDDTVWRVAGPDLPAGARVRVAKVSPSELELIVEAA